jgi:hypothetical protein
MVGRFWTSGRERTRQVMLTICKSFVPVSEAMFLSRHRRHGAHRIISTDMREVCEVAAT